MTIKHVPTTALFCPADRPDRALKALTSSADQVILDLEDAVSPDSESKLDARRNLKNLLQSDNQIDVVIRVNEPGTVEGDLDLEELARLSMLDDIPALKVMIPKLTLNTPLELIPGELEIIALVETAAAVQDIYEIASVPRISRLALGAVDLSAELGCSPRSSTIDYVRSQLVIASAAAGITPPLDSPCVKFQDPEVVEIAARKAKNDGFGGMLCIHPKQLDIVSRVFLPSKEEIEWARKVLDAGDAASSLDGEMIDRPVIFQAQRIMDAIK